MNKAQTVATRWRVGRLACYGTLLALMAAPSGCNDTVDQSGHHDTIPDGGELPPPAPPPTMPPPSSYNCPDDPPPDPDPDCTTHTAEDGERVALSVASVCGPQLDASDGCKLVVPEQENTHCDDKAIEWAKSFDEVTTAACEKLNAMTKAAKSQSECDGETSDCENIPAMYQSDPMASAEWEACHCEKAEKACAEAAMDQFELQQKSQEYLCDVDKQAQAHCELTNCTLEPECSCGTTSNVTPGSCCGALANGACAEIDPTTVEECYSPPPTGTPTGGP